MDPNSLYYQGTTGAQSQNDGYNQRNQFMYQYSQIQNEYNQNQNYSQDSFYNRQSQALVSQSQQNQFSQQLQQQQRLNQFKQQNQLDSDGQFQGNQQNGLQLPNINNNSSQRQPSSKRYEKPKRDHSLKAEDTSQKKSINNNQQQTQYNQYQLPEFSKIQTQAQKNLNEQRNSKNQFSSIFGNQASAQSDKQKIINNASQVNVAKNNFKIEQKNVSPTQAQLMLVPYQQNKPSYNPNFDPQTKQIKQSNPQTTQYMNINNQINQVKKQQLPVQPQTTNKYLVTQFELRQKQQQSSGINSSQSQKQQQSSDINLSQSQKQQQIRDINSSQSINQSNKQIQQQVDFIRPNSAQNSAQNYQQSEIQQQTQNNYLSSIQEVNSALYSKFQSSLQGEQQSQNQEMKGQKDQAFYEQEQEQQLASYNNNNLISNTFQNKQIPQNYKQQIVTAEFGVQQQQAQNDNFIQQQQQQLQLQQAKFEKNMPDQQQALLNKQNQNNGLSQSEQIPQNYNNLQLVTTEIGVQQYQINNFIQWQQQSKTSEKNVIDQQQALLNIQNQTNSLAQSKQIPQIQEQYQQMASPIRGQDKQQVPFNNQNAGNELDNTHQTPQIYQQQQSFYQKIMSQSRVGDNNILNYQNNTNQNKQEAKQSQVQQNKAEWDQNESKKMMQTRIQKEENQNNEARNQMLGRYNEIQINQAQNTKQTQIQMQNSQIKSQQIDTVQKTKNIGGNPKEAFKFMSQQKINSDYEAISNLADKVISLEVQKNIETLQQEVNKKDLNQIDKVEEIKKVINQQIKQFETKINFNELGQSNLKLFDEHKVLEMFNLPPNIYKSCLKELQIIQQRISEELISRNTTQIQFDTKFSQEILKDMLFKYLQFNTECEIKDLISFNCVAIQKLTSEKLKTFKANQQLNLGQQQLKILKSNFEYCLDCITKEIQNELDQKIKNSIHEEKGLEVIKKSFKNKKNEMINQIQKYFSLIQNVYKLHCLSVVIAYKKIQIIQDQLNKILEDFQETLSNMINEAFFKQNKKNIDSISIEGEISRQYRQFIQNDTIDIIQKLRKIKQNQMFQMAFCQFDQAPINKFYSSETAKSMLKTLTKIDNYKEFFDRITLDYLRNLFEENQSFLQLFEAVLSQQNLSNWTQINFTYSQEILIFFIRKILKLVCKKIGETEICVSKIKGDFFQNFYCFNSQLIDECYQSQNQQLPFYNLVFSPNTKILDDLKENMVCARIDTNLDLQEIQFRFGNFSKEYSYQMKQVFTKYDFLQEDIAQLIDQFEVERRNLPKYLYQLEKSHKCGLIFMYIYEKYTTIQKYIIKKKNQNLGTVIIKFFQKEFKFEDFLEKFSFVFFQKSLEQTYQFTLDLIQYINRSKTLSSLNKNNKQVVWKNTLTDFQQHVDLLSKYIKEGDQIVILQDQKQNLFIIAFKSQKQYVVLIMQTQTNYEEQKGILSNTTTQKLIFTFEFQLLMFQSFLNEISKDKSEIAEQFFCCYIELLKNFSQNSNPIHFNDDFLNNLFNFVKGIQVIQNTQDQTQDYEEQEKIQLLCQQKQKEQLFLEQQQQQKQQLVIQKSQNKQKEFNLSQSENAERQNLITSTVNSKLTRDQKMEMQINSTQYGKLQDPNIDKILSNEDSTQNNKYKQYCIDNFQGQINQASFNKIVSQNKKQFNVDYLKQIGYIDQIIDIRQNEMQSIKVEKNKSLIYLIGNKQDQFLIQIKNKAYFFYFKDKPEQALIIQHEDIQLKKQYQSQYFYENFQLYIFQALVYLKDQQINKISQLTLNSSESLEKFQLNQQYLWIVRQIQEVFYYQKQYFDFVEQNLLGIKLFKIQNSEMNKLKIYFIKSKEENNQFLTIFYKLDSYQNIQIVFLDNEKQQFQSQINEIISLIESRQRENSISPYIPKQNFIFKKQCQNFNNEQQQKLILSCLKIYLEQEATLELPLIVAIETYLKEYREDICFPLKISINRQKNKIY